MGTKARHERLEPLIEEFNALSDTIWSPASKKKHAADFGRFLAWLVETGRPPTTESLELPTLLAYVKHLLTKPPVRDVWRGDPEAVSKALQGARPGDSLSKNTVHSYMSPLRTLCSHLRKEGILAIDPFLKARQRGGDGNPLLPKEKTLPKGASLDDLAAVERGAAGRTPLDLRDQAIIALMKTTTARNSSVRLLRMRGPRGHL